MIEQPTVRRPHTPADQQRVDLKQFVQGLHRPPHLGAATVGQYRRITSMIESDPVPITALPLPATGYVDGAQATVVAGRKGHRDILLTFVGAGVGRGKELLHVVERLAALCSAQDEEYVRAAGGGVDVVALPELFPWNLSLAQQGWIDEARRAAEWRVLQEAPHVPGHFLVVDGALSPAHPRTDTVGVIKAATDTDWITDPGLIPTRERWRSPALLLPAQRAGERDRLTAYLRLRPCDEDRPWSYSLIRLEVFADAGIETLDALAIQQRQGPGVDPRWEVQLQNMYWCEQALRARVPVAVRVLR